MTSTSYSDLAANCVSGQSTVWVNVDNNPGAGGITNTNPFGMVKLDAGQTADAFNDIKAHIDERFGGIVSSNPAIFIGDSAGGFSAIGAMQENKEKVNNGGKLGFKPDGFIAADPIGKDIHIPSLTIECPTFAMGFTVQTCAVTLDKAGLAAYNVTSNRGTM